MNEQSLLDAAPAILEASSEAILTIDNNGKIKGCNSQFLILIGLKNEAEIEDWNINQLFQDYDFSVRHRDHIDVFRPTKLTKPGGTVSTVLIKAIPVGRLSHSFQTILIQDPEAIRRIIDHLDYIESFDVETGLLNRHKGTIEFEQLQTSDLSGGCFLINTKLPEDKAENNYGEILKKISACLSEISEEFISCRYSETELLFVYAASPLPDETTQLTAIEAIKKLFPQNDDMDIWISYQEWVAGKMDVGSLINNLRHHLIQLHSPHLPDEIFNQTNPNTRVVFLKSLEDALNAGQLDFFIQPQINSENRHVAGGELLIRWQPKPGEIIPPSQFVDFIEQGEFGKTFLHWSIKRSAEILREIHTALGRWVPLSLNVASHYFTRDILVDPMIECLREADIPFENLEIEITERVLAENPKDVMETLYQLRENGFPAAIDDFGTGYSSLSYLRKFPLDRLKIDRVFVTNLAENEEDRLITVAIASLAHVLGLEIVVEGIENNTQGAFLKNIGCEYFQGYLTGKPMPVAQFIDFCRDNDLILDGDEWSSLDMEDAKVSSKHRKVVWKKSFSTDVVSVDNEHRDLIDLLNAAMESYLEDPESVDMCETLDLLAAETIKHFDHEETVMRNMSYPRYEMHREKHKWLIADISKRKAELEENPQATNFEELMQYVKYWLLRHLISEDTHILRFLNKSNRERRIS